MVQRQRVVRRQIRWKRACPCAAESRSRCRRGNEAVGETASGQGYAKEQKAHAISPRWKRARRSGDRSNRRTAAEVNEIGERHQAVQVGQDDAFGRKPRVVVVAPKVVPVTPELDQ